MLQSAVQRFYAVESCQEVAAKTYLLRFTAPEITCSVRPGQFVNILTGKDGAGPFLRRPFSIARIDGNSVEILFHVVGRGTVILSKKRSGDEIDVLGPLGQSFRVDADYDTAFFAAGGIGVASFPFLTDVLKKQGRHVETFLGWRNADQVYTTHLLNIHMATDDGSLGFHGNVVQLIEPFLDRKDFGKIKIFACGPTVMLRALSDLAKRKNICCEMSLEGQMACGVGICQGCPVERSHGSSKYALICKEGPTFISTDVHL